MTDASPATVPCLLPERRALVGPVTFRRIVRLGLIYLAVFAVGVALAYGTDNAHGQAFGLGLILPGGGFLAYADLQSLHGVIHLAAGLASLAAFGLALVLWFATGNALAPPAVWLLCALAAATMSHGAINRAAIWGVPLTALAGFAVVIATARTRKLLGIAQRRAANRHLEAVARRTVEAAPRETSAAEFSPNDLKLMRFLLDRALQPVEAFDGFEWLDQFQTAAVRYQLNFAGYALSMAQATHLPALGGYLHEAQRRLIQKQADHRVWRYWALENLWGNLSRDPDPVARQNIMFTGFVATQMAMYHAASGRREYDQPGSFALRHPDGRRFDYDLGALVVALDREARRSAFGLVACEPNWIYPLCNTIGAAAMRSHDRMHGQDRWPSLAADFRNRLEQEFIDLAGRFVPCRSDYTGFALPMIGGTQPQAMPCFFLNAIFPDIALRHWLLLRRELFQDGGLTLNRRPFWRIDTGNYRFSRAAAFAGTALAAVELGDRDVALACLAALDEECPARDDGGHSYRPDASVWSHAVEFFARSGTQNGFRRLIEHPRPEGRGPVLSDVSYPEVLVASAIETSGMLRAVLYPGGQPGRHRLGLAGLVQGGRYACDGVEEAELVAGRAGDAVVTAALGGRTEIRIRPMA